MTLDTTKHDRQCSFGASNQQRQRKANLSIDSISVGRPAATELTDDNRQTECWPVKFEVLNPTEPDQKLRAVMFCYRDPDGEWNSKVTNLDVVQDGTARIIPKYAFCEMGLEWMWVS
jgi:hypothetical protein